MDIEPSSHFQHNRTGRNAYRTGIRQVRMPLIAKVFIVVALSLLALLIVAVLRATPATARVSDSVGVGNERLRWGVSSTSLLGWDEDKVAIEYARGEPLYGKVNLVGSLGRRGFATSLSVLVLDRWALADPYRARLPYDPATSRMVFPLLPGLLPGHLARPFGADYIQSVETGVTIIEDPEMRELYEDVLLLTRGPLFTVVRWRAILRHIHP